MHVCGLGLAFLVNAKFDSMGDVVDGGVGIVAKASPRRAAIVKAQSELRQEYDVRDERRRELEFLEKGGDPLDFKLGQVASISIQSTSYTDQHHEQIVTRVAEHSVLFTAPHLGDSIETCRRPEGSSSFEPNSADNLLLFNAENELLEVGSSVTLPSKRNNIALSEKSSQMGGCQNAKESEESAIFRPYARRNRSKSNRDGARSSTADIIPSRAGHALSLPVCNTLTKGDLFEVGINVTAPSDKQENEQNQHIKVSVPQTDINMAPMTRPDIVSGIEESADFECNTPCAVITKTEKENSSSQLNEFSNLETDKDRAQIEVQNICAALSTQNSDSGLKENYGSGVCSNAGNVENNGIIKDNLYSSEGSENLAGEVASDIKELQPVHNCVSTNGDYEPVLTSSIVKVEEEMHTSGPDLQNMVHISSKIEELETNDLKISETDGKLDIISKPNIEISSICELTHTSLAGKDTAEATGLKTSEDQLTVVNKSHEDSVLEEARIIQAKRKRISELSTGTLLLENRQRSQWDFVLEEMVWLANDFAQERLWKTFAASQICKQAASFSQSKFDEQYNCREQKKVAFTLAKAIMDFWRSVEVLVSNDNSSFILNDRNFDLDGNEDAHGKFGEPNMTISKDLEHRLGESIDPVKRYGVRFLIYNKTIVPCVQEKASLTPDRMPNLRIQESLYEDQYLEESLFYKVLYGSMESYRNSIESFFMQEEVDTSMYDAVEENSQENTYCEEEDISMYYYEGGFEASKLSQKKRKNFTRAYTSRSFEPGDDLQFGYEACANNPNAGSIPTKRVRTASRSRVQNPFNTGNAHGLNNTDASSGDTNSFQDDQCTLQSGALFQKSMEVESMADFEKHLQFDSGEISAKPKKKKKKAKHLISRYEQRWQHDSIVHNELSNNSKRKFDGHRLESNGSSGVLGQYNAKKQKVMKHSLDNTFENISSMIGAIPSPTASQMSNMSNNKLIRLIGGKDKTRKIKTLKMPDGQPDIGSQWSQFEEQALVVLVHDMGPNWELVCDAFNSTLHFKCIFRKPQECEEHHKNLMDRPAGDGADSAEDSGASQPYPSTLPGIPKGSARQLFQRLQGPMEEDTLKSHFERIISIGRRQHYQRSQNNNQDFKQKLPIHDSHVDAYPRVRQSGGFLTPLDLCNAPDLSPDIISHGFKGPHSTGLSNSNQGSVAPILTGSGENSSLLGSSSTVLGNVTSPYCLNNKFIRDGRYGIPKPSPIDEQQTLQQYSPIISGRNIGTDRGARMLHGGNGMGMIGGMNRRMSIPGYSSVQGNSTVQPREALHMTRNPEHQGQMLLPELQVTQGHGQGVPSINGASSNFSNHAASPNTSYPQQYQMSAQQAHVLQNPNHPRLQGPNHPSYAQLKQRQLQQQRILQQQRHFSESNASKEPAQTHPQTQLAVSSSVPNNAQIQQTSNGIGRIPQNGTGGLNNQMVKQRQRHALQFQQAGRYHPQQHAKLLKGIGRGNMIMHQNQVASDPSHSNGISMNQGSPGSDLNSGQQSRPVMTQSISNQTQTQQKFTPSSSLLKQVPSHSNNSSQNHISPLTSSSQCQNPVSQPQPSVQKVHNQNYQGNSVFPSDSLAGQPQIDQRPVNNKSCMESNNLTPETVNDSGRKNLTTTLGSVEGSILKKLSRGNFIPSVIEEESSQKQGPPHQTQQHMQHMQSQQGSLYSRPSNS